MYVMHTLLASLSYKCEKLFFVNIQAVEYCVSSWLGYPRCQSDFHRLCWAYRCGSLFLGLGDESNHARCSPEAPVEKLLSRRHATAQKRANNDVSQCIMIHCSNRMELHRFPSVLHLKPRLRGD